MGLRRRKRFTLSSFHVLRRRRRRPHKRRRAAHSMNVLMPFLITSRDCGCEMDDGIRVDLSKCGIPLKKMHTHTYASALMWSERESLSRSRQQNSWKCRRDIFHSSRGFICNDGAAQDPFLFASHTHVPGVGRKYAFEFHDAEFALHLQLNRIIRAYIFTSTLRLHIYL